LAASTIFLARLSRQLSVTTDFWPSCGYGLLQPNARGWLAPTAAYFDLFLQRPELALVSESCRAEIKLHQSLRQAPLRPVPAQELEGLKDGDARDNYRLFLGFRDALVASGTLEQYCLDRLRPGAQTVPPDFIDLLVQAVLRHLLKDSTDALLARAAELLFRPQRITLQDGQLLAADRALVERQAENAGLGELGRLLLQSKAQLRTLDLQVLDEDNAARYWPHSERFNFVLDLTHEITQELSHGLTLRMNRARSGLKALSRVLELWVHHFLDVEVRIEPLQKIDDPAWRWHVGLDAESSALLNDLYLEQPVTPERLARLISLFRLDFTNPADMRADVAGKPVYLGLAMTAQNTLRLKPQNLLLNLPLKRG
jgi:hypothetical protein